MIRDTARISLILNEHSVALTLDEACELRDFLVELLGSGPPLGPSIAVVPHKPVSRVSLEEL